jgi:acyl-CoA thioester hydrolase
MNSKIDLDLLRCPFKTRKQKVLSEWIDYNGHMNVAYYTLAFDRALDIFFEDVLGLGESYVEEERKGPFALKASYHYHSELLVAEEFYVDLSVFEYSLKKIHLFGEMRKNKSSELSAVFETVLMNVDLEKRKSIEYPENVLRILNKLKNTLEVNSIPKVIGKGISINR